MAKRNSYFLLRVKGEFDVKTSYYREDEDDHPFSVMWSGKSVEYKTSTSTFKEAEFGVKEIYADEVALLNEWREREKQINGFLTSLDKEVFGIGPLELKRTPVKFQDRFDDLGTFELDEEDFNLLRKNKRVKPGQNEFYYLVQTNGPKGNSRTQTIWGPLSGETVVNELSGLRFNWGQLRSTYNPREVYEIEGTDPDGWTYWPEVYDHCHNRQVKRETDEYELLVDLLRSAGIEKPLPSEEV